MLTASIPSDWKDLQIAVGMILSECGFEVVVEKKVATVRGSVELDVWAQEEIQGRKFATVCECKHWRARVPQNVVHGFRTVLTDIGAHVGYIISTSGFQEGAFQAAASTNVELVTWDQFQAVFAATWFKAYMSPYIAARLDPLLSYTEPLLPGWFGDLSVERQAAFLALKERYDEFGWIIMSFTPYSRAFREHGLPKLPLIDQLPPDSSAVKNVPANVLRAVGLRDFLEAAVAFGDEIIMQFRALRPN
ncbi:MAG: restriction endonuclease [Gemmatimonadota bacterium]